MPLSDFIPDPDFVRALQVAQGLAIKGLSPTQIETRIIARFPMLGTTHALDAARFGLQLKALAEEIAGASFSGPVGSLRFAGGLTFPLTVQVAWHFSSVIDTPPGRGVKHNVIRNVRFDVSSTDEFADVVEKMIASADAVGDFDVTVATGQLISNARVV